MKSGSYFFSREILILGPLSGMNFFSQQNFILAHEIGFLFFSREIFILGPMSGMNFFCRGNFILAHEIGFLFFFSRNLNSRAYERDEFFLLGKMLRPGPSMGNDTK